MTNFYSKLVKERTQDFIAKYGGGIANSIADTGLYFPAVIAQSAFESGYGENIPQGSNNFGGIKYNPNLQGVVGYVDSLTTEVIGGRLKKVVQRFAKFKDVESGFRGHVEVLMKDRYKEAREKAKSPEEQIKMIVKAGYSTKTPDAYLNQMKGIIDAARDISQLGRIVKQKPTTQTDSKDFFLAPPTFKQSTPTNFQIPFQQKND
jgi:hypothetical protein